MYSEADIYNLLNEQLGVDPLRIDIYDDIYNSMGVDGDDFFELIDEFKGRFNVDMTNYLWYFHHAEEGSGIGCLLFRSPDKRVKRIAITPKLLLEAANAGYWPVEYPKHNIPDKRYDMLFTNIFSLLIFVLVIWLTVKKYFN